MPQRPRKSVDDQMEHILDRALGGSRGSTQGWACVKKDKKQNQDNAGNWTGTVKLIFEKTKGRKDDPNTVEGQWIKVLEMVKTAGQNTQQYNKYPWIVIDDDASEDPVEEAELLAESENGEGDTGNEIKDIKHEHAPGVTDVLVPAEVLTIDQLRERFPYSLLMGTDEEIEAHDAFKGIYGRGPQIRATLSSIHSFIESGGERSNHTLLWGLPACAKTAILLGIIKLFGEGAVLRLDSTSTTRAGLERLIFKDLKVVPPIFICEEIEKADEQALRIWLGAMDDRHEFRKVNYHMHQVRRVNFLTLATANDKEKFDGMMGGRPGYPGALSSRFVHHWECPRPNETQMRMILKRDIQRFGGDMAWIDPCIALSQEIGTDDPRKVLGFLDGGVRLLDGSYRKDMLAIYKKN
jgi:hypothetical protein